MAVQDSTDGHQTTFSRTSKSSIRLEKMRCLSSSLHKAVARPPLRSGTALRSTAPSGYQTYTINGKTLQVPLAAVQQLPEPTQAVVVAGVFAALGLGTYVTCTTISPALASAAPDAFDFAIGAVGPVASLLFATSGVLHLLPAGHEDFCSMYPKQGEEAEVRFLVDQK